MSTRTIAIGDIHGCATALSVMVDAMDVRPEDTVVTLGDYVGKGPDSRGVLELLIALHGRCRLVPLLGNHDILMRSAVNGELNQSAWSMFGAVRILNSYGTVQAIESIPATHRDFLRSCKLYHETDHTVCRPWSRGFLCAASTIQRRGIQHVQVPCQDAGRWPGNVRLPPNIPASFATQNNYTHHFDGCSPLRTNHLYKAT